MLALEITDIRTFMAKLLIADTFDEYQTIEASVTTFNTFHIDGRIHAGYYHDENSEEAVSPANEFSFWHDLKPFCLSIIKGKRTPLRFCFVFSLKRRDTESLLESEGLSSLLQSIGSLVMTLRFENSILTCTSGISFNTFIQDKSAERIWDAYLLDFLKAHDIAFRER